MTDHKQAIWLIVLLTVMFTSIAVNTDSLFFGFVGGFFFSALVEVALTKSNKE